MLLQRIEEIAQYDFVNVLLTGETGVGKTYYAKHIHAHSNRRNRPLVAINCAAIPGDLIESELFGSERGAFTGAVGAVGKFEAADGGTVFLDEVGELDQKIQAKLLAVLEDKSIRRVGSNKSKVVDVRFIFATNRDLSIFRSDFLYRISSFTIEIPPLRERKEEITPLVRQFLREFNLQNKQKIHFSDEIFELLAQNEWFGNLRELKNYVTQLCLFGLLEKTSRITLRELSNMSPIASVKSTVPYLMPETIPHVPYRNTKQKITPSLEKAIKLYQEKKYNVADILAQTGVARTTFYRQLGKQTV